MQNFGPAAPPSMKRPTPRSPNTGRHRRRRCCSVLDGFPNHRSNRLVVFLQVILVFLVILGGALLAFQIHYLQHHLQDFATTVERYISLVDHPHHHHHHHHPPHDGGDSLLSSHEQWKQEQLKASGVTASTTTQRRRSDYSGHSSSSSSTATESVMSPAVIQAAAALRWNRTDLADRQAVLKVLQQGGYELNSTEFMTPALLSSLPKWSEIINAYGPPKLVGLERCVDYQEAVTSEETRNIGVAGAFDSGTNLLHALLESNCIFESRGQERQIKGINWQVPWGKHYPAQYRTNHSTSGKGGKVPPETTLPIVVVRDPMTWMQSMCRQAYAAQFDHDDKTCPNIIPYPGEIEAHPRYGKMKYIPVHATYDGGLRIKYESLAHFWNLWYQAYISDEDVFPRLIVRMEDLVFHAETVVPQICRCAGATFRGHLSHTKTVRNLNKGINQEHVDQGLLRSVVRYGNITNRRSGYPTFQLQAVHDILDPAMMELFGYTFEEP